MIRTILATILLIPSLASALVVDGTARFSSVDPPSSNPWFYNIGITQSGASCIYMGNGWVLTANHVGVSNVRFFNDVNSITHYYIPGTTRYFEGVDLIMFRVEPTPLLPDMVLNELIPLATDDVMLMGRGMTAGLPVLTGLSGPNRRGIIGYYWNPTFYTSWGENDIRWSKDQLVMEFNKLVRFNESTAAPGDSGGAVFLKQSRGVNLHWALAGVIVSISTMYLQEPGTSLFGNFTYAVNLLQFNTKIKGILNE